jgi:hypothetical protein
MNKILHQLCQLINASAYAVVDKAEDDEKNGQFN